MIPKSLSASSLLTAEACMARWKTENYDRTPQVSGVAASIGTSVHFALEMFVKAVYIDKTIEWDNVKYLRDMYEIGYIDTFNSTDTDTPEYADGAAIVAKWYDRNKTGLPDTVLSCEVKENFPVKTSAGTIPFNFIWDRADQIDDVTYHVVDYKTIRAYISPQDLKDKIQPRAYALAAQIKWPHAERIWVSFDMLRHDGLVGAVFTRDENAQTYRFIKRAAERIIATDENNTPETLNSECKWCIRKVTCETLLKSIAGGTSFSLSADEAAEKKLQISSQILALKYAEEELDKIILAEAENNDIFEWETSTAKVEITARKTRSINSNAAAQILGPEITAKYGNFTITNIDKLLKSGELSPEKEKAVKELISFSWSSPSPKVKPLSPFEDGV